MQFQQTQCPVEWTMKRGHSAIPFHQPLVANLLNLIWTKDHLKRTNKFAFAVKNLKFSELLRLR